jgi:hypothetical protein
MRSSEGAGDESRGAPRRGKWAAETGAVSAEAAIVIPALALITMALVWALTVASAQIQCVDAARAGARAAARSEPQAATIAAVRSAAPHGARITLGRSGDLWRIRVEAPMPGPGPLALTVDAAATALAEDEVGAERGADGRRGSAPGKEATRADADAGVNAEAGLWQGVRR